MPFDGVGFVADESLQKIDAVIDLLAVPDKWCKGALRSHDGRYCIRGAVRSVDAADVLEPTILKAIGEVAGKRFRRIESFNDHPHTSHDQVLAVLGRTREAIRAGQRVPVSDQIVGKPASRLTAWRGAMLGWFGA